MKIVLAGEQWSPVTSEEATLAVSEAGDEAEVAMNLQEAVRRLDECDAVISDLHFYPFDPELEHPHRNFYLGGVPPSGLVLAALAIAQGKEVVISEYENRTPGTTYISDGLFMPRADVHPKRKAEPGRDGGRVDGVLSQPFGWDETGIFEVALNILKQRMANSEPRRRTGG